MEQNVVESRLLTQTVGKTTKIINATVVRMTPRASVVAFRAAA